MHAQLSVRINKNTSAQSAIRTFKLGVITGKDCLTYVHRILVNVQFAIFFVTFNYVKVQVIILVVTLNVQLTLTIHMDGLIMGHMKCNVGMFIFFRYLTHRYIHVHFWIYKQFSFLQMCRENWS